MSFSNIFILLCKLEMSRFCSKAKLSDRSFLECNKYKTFYLLARCDYILNPGNKRYLP